MCVCVCARFTYCNFIFIVNKALAHTTHTGTATDTHTRIPHTLKPLLQPSHTHKHTRRVVHVNIYSMLNIFCLICARPRSLLFPSFSHPPSLSLSSHLLPHHNSVYKLLKSKIIEKQLQQQLQIQQTYKKWKKRNIWKTKKNQLVFFIMSSHLYSWWRLRDVTQHSKTWRGRKCGMLYILYTRYTYVHMYITCMSSLRSTRMIEELFPRISLWRISVK